MTAREAGSESGAVTEGDLAPDFDLVDQDGQARHLSTMLADGPVVLFFYPHALSRGCTAESCHFRDLAAEFGGLGAQRVGISPDTVEKQKQFSDKHDFDYPLLADADGAVAASFGIKRGFGPLPVKRRTYVIDTDRRVLAVISSETRMSVHADRALDALRARTAAS